MRVTGLHVFGQLTLDRRSITNAADLFDTPGISCLL